jgi:hypothetical protein
LRIRSEPALTRLIQEGAARRIVDAYQQIARGHSLRLDEAAFDDPAGYLAADPYLFSPTTWEIAKQWRDAGLTGAADERGKRRRERCLAKSGNARVRRGMLQTA